MLDTTSMPFGRHRGLAQQARTRAPSLLLACLLLLMAGCSPGVIADAVRPDIPDVHQALDQVDEASFDCQNIGQARPLVVDWGSQDRLDLELAMRRRVAVVHYGCDGLKLLPSCSLPGSYRFVGVSRKEDVVQLSGMDEIAANLPFSAVKLRGEMKRDSAIDLALVMVGKHITATDTGPRLLLEGECKGATHFVHSSYVGAFAMDRGSKGQLRALVEVFGAGGETGSSKKARRAAKDGELDACRKTSSRDEAPRDQCQAMLRVELYPLSDDKPKPDESSPAKPAKAAEQKPARSTCPKGMVQSGGKCTTKQSAQSFVCERDDVRECDAQCRKGDATSCYNLALLYGAGQGVEQSWPEALKLSEKACRGGHNRACMYFHQMAAYCTARARRDKTDEAACRVGDSKALLEIACEAGDGSACGVLGTMVLRADPKRWHRYTKRACDLGYGYSCFVLATAMLSGTQAGILKDEAGAVVLLRRACEGGDFTSCAQLANFYEKGEHGVPKDLAAATKLEARICVDHNAIGACVKTAKRYRDAPPGVSRNRPAAMRFFRKACGLQESRLAGEACHALAEMLRFQFGFSGKPLTEAERAEALNAYFEGCRLKGVGCDFAMRTARRRSFRHDKKQCISGDSEACERLERQLAVSGCKHGRERQCERLGALSPPRLKALCIASKKRASVPCQIFARQGGAVPTFPGDKPEEEASDKKPAARPSQ